MNAALLDRLRARWSELTGACRDRAASDSSFQGIITSYSEPQRAYHTLAHLDSVFALLDLHATDAKETARLAFACWYHDIVYDPRSIDNEARSAERASAELTHIGIDADLVQRIDRLIRATAMHQTAEADEDDALFLDADFAILGASSETYAAYVSGVRFEYAHIDQNAWRTGRGEFLRKALAAERLFRTDVFESSYGERARANMAAELAALA